MTFDEFKSLALNPLYIDSRCVYRVEIHRYINQIKDATNDMEYEVKLCQSFMYTDWQRVLKMIPQFIHHERYNQHLYALYIYQLPVNTDVSDNLYQRLWVYDRNGNLIAQSMCTTLMEELDTSSAKFRGRAPESIRFKPGDVVEVYDRENDRVRLGVVIKQPPTIEQCWEMRKEVEKACIAEGIGAGKTDDNYWLYASDDCYCVVYGPDCELSYPQTTDVFPIMYPISDKLRHHFAECYQHSIEHHHDQINTNRITEENTASRIKEIRRLINLI